MTKNKIVLTAAASLAVLGILASVAGAQTTSTGSGAPNFMPEARMVLQVNASGHAQLAGTVVSVQSSSLTVKSWGGNWTVNVNSDTKLARRFGAKSSLSEFAAGDYVQITGTVDQNSAWTIDAKTARNQSIQVKNASFYGTISNVSSSGFSLATKARGNVSVTLNSDTKIYVNGKSASASDLANGMAAMVGGVWDRTQTTVTANRVNARTPRPAGNSSSTEH